MEAIDRPAGGRNHGASSPRVRRTVSGDGAGLGRLPACLESVVPICMPRRHGAPSDVSWWEDAEDRWVFIETAAR